MNDESILVAEDDPLWAEFIINLLIAEGYHGELALNGKEALDMYNAKPYDVVISDMDMPEMSGGQLLLELNKLKVPPVFIVETADNRPDTIVNMMKLGVYDFFIKPIEPKDFIFKLKKAIELANLRKSQRTIEILRQSRFDQKENVNVLKERMVARAFDTFDEILFSSLRTSFSQGAGIGAMITLISMLKKKVQKLDDTRSVVDSEIINLLFKNADFADEALNTVNEIYEILHNPPELVPTSIEDVHLELEKVLGQIESYAKIKSHKILMNDDYLNKESTQVLINLDSMKKVFIELIKNALKFSPPASTIYIFTKSSKSMLHINFLNDTGPSDLINKKSFNKGYDKLIFEPFFRLSSFVKEEYDTLDFGLGLTLVEKIIRANNGSLSVAIVNDKSHYNQEPDHLKLSFEIEIPISRETR